MKSPVRAEVHFVDVADVEGGKLVWDVKHDGLSVLAASVGPFRPDLLKQLYPSWDEGSAIELPAGVVLGTFAVHRRDEGTLSGWASHPNYVGIDAARTAGATHEFWSQVHGRLVRLAVWPRTRSATHICRIYNPFTDDTARDMSIRWDSEDGNFYFTTEPRIQPAERLIVRSKSDRFVIVRSCDFLVEMKETKMVTREEPV